MRLDDASANRQTQSKAVGLGGEERFEQMHALRGVESRAKIDNVDDETIVGTRQRNNFV